MHKTALSFFSCVCPTTGRGLPDVSLLGASYLFILNNSTSSFYGTSTSAPVFAGMVSLVNAARVAAGKPTLGWINPALYALSSQFVNDITVGDNKCTSSYDDNGLICCAQGFKTAVGWDPVTGLGSVEQHNISLSSLIIIIFACFKNFSC